MQNKTSVLSRAALAGLLFVFGCSSEVDGTGQTPVLIGTGGSPSSAGGMKATASGGVQATGSSTGGASSSTGGAPNAAGGAPSSTGGTANAAGGTPSLAGPMEPAPLTGITAAHNAVRAQAMPAPASPLTPLTWDATIAATAQQWADGCMFKHSQGKYGENIYATTGSASAQQVVDSWASESADYNYANNACAPNQSCGHYTQIVWGKSLRLGCAAKQCSQNSPFSGSPNWQFWVCNYDPPGNFVGQKPY